MKETTKGKLKRKRGKGFFTIVLSIVVNTIRAVKGNENRNFTVSDITPEYYLNDQFDLSFSKDLEDLYFRKRLDRVLAEIVEIKEKGKKVKVVSSKRVLIPERYGQSEEVEIWVGRRVLAETKKMFEIELQKPFNSSAEKIYTRSDLFWPGNKPDEGRSLANLGLDIVVEALDAITYKAELISSMVFFEKIILRTEMHSKLYFKAIVLTPTISDQYLKSVLDFSTNHTHNYNNKNITCDSAEYVNNAKVYIICWSATNPPSTLTEAKNPDGILEIYLAVSHYLKADESDKIMVKSSKKIYYKKHKVNDTIGNKNDYNSITSIYTHLSFNGQENSTNLVIWDEEGYFFIIFQIENDRLTKRIYPEFKSHSALYMPFYLYKSNAAVVGEQTNKMNYVKVHKIYTLKKNCYIIQEKIGAEDEQVPITWNVYYINTVTSNLAKHIAEGMYMNIENRDKGDTSLFRQIFIFNEEERNTTNNKINYRGKLKTLIFDSDNFYYNGNSVEIKGVGNPELHQFWSSQSYYISASTEVKFKDDDEMPLDQMGFNQYSKKATINIVSKEDPDISFKIFEIEDYVHIEVSPQNNFIYVRKKYKTDVIRLQEVLIDFDINYLMDKVNKTFNISDNARRVKGDHDATHHFKFYFLERNETRKELNSSVSIEKDFGDLIINQFSVFNYPYMDLFKVKSPEKKLVIDQTSSVPIKFTYLNFGNFLYFKHNSSMKAGKESSKSDNDAIINAFSDYSPLIPQFRYREASGRRGYIQSLFAIQNIHETYYFINMGGDPSNTIWQHKPDINDFEPFLELRDHRKLESVRFLDINNYLLEVGELIYHLDVQKKKYIPIYKSEDLCGKVSTIVHHSILGKLTVCGGNERLSIFETDFESENIDFSVPNKNVYIDEIISNEFKTLQIASLISTRTHPNHFGLVSKIIEEAVSKPNSNGDGGKNSQTVKKIKVRFYEICVGKEKIEIFLVESQVIVLNDSVESLKPYLVGKYFVILIKNNPAMKKDQEPFVYEEIWTYRITNSFDLIKEKVYKQEENIRFNFIKNKPIITLLEESSETKADKVQKMAFLTQVTLNLKNNIPNLYFQDKKKIVNVITIFDPALPALSCMNIIRLPEEFEPLKIGPMMINGIGEFKGIGLLVYGKKFKKHRIFHMVNHFFEIDYHFYRNLESFFSSRITENKTFNYQVANYQSSDEKNVYNASVSFTLIERSPAVIKLSGNLSNNTNLTFNLMDSKHKIIKLTDDKNTLEIEGAIYGIDFEYESPLEEKSERLAASYMNEKKPLMDDKIYKAKMSLWEELKWNYNTGIFDTSAFDIEYPVNSEDYIELLSMDMKMVMHEDTAKDTWSYLNMFKGMRQISSTIVALKYNTDRSDQNIVNIEEYAEVGAGIVYDPKKKKQIKIYIFDNCTKYNDENKTKGDAIEQTYRAQRITKDAIESRNQTVEISYENEIDLKRIRIYKSLNVLVIAQFAQSKNIVVEYDVILLRGVDKSESGDGKSARVLPIPVEKRRMHEKVWWYDMDVMTSLMYTKINGTVMLMERICIVGVYRTTKLNLYFRCATDYALKELMLLNNKGSTFYNMTNFRAVIGDSIGDIKKSKEPLIKGIDIFYNLGKYLHSKDKEGGNYMSTRLEFTIKVPDKMNYLLKLDPNLESNAKYMGIHLREIFNPFTGFREKLLFQDISMGNVYIRPIIFKQKSFIIYYFLPDNWGNDNNFTYLSQVVNAKVTGHDKGGIKFIGGERKSEAEIKRELKQNIITPIQIFNFTGNIVNLASFQLFSKNETVTTGFIESFFDFSSTTEIGRTVVCRAIEEKCGYIPEDSFDILVKVNQTRTYSRIYRVNFMPQIELKSKSSYLVSDWINATFKGFFNVTVKKEILIKSKSMKQPIEVVLYLLPMVILLSFVWCLIVTLKHIFSIYTLKLSNTKTEGSSPLNDMLFRFASKRERELQIQLKDVKIKKGKSRTTGKKTAQKSK